MITPEVSAALSDATDVVGYVPYVNRVAPREGLTRHGSDNREEIRRAEQALQLALEGHRVVVVSSGVLLRICHGLGGIRSAGSGRCRVARAGYRTGAAGYLRYARGQRSCGCTAGPRLLAASIYPNNLKPWALIEKRLRLAVEADFAMAFYNPR